MVDPDDINVKNDVVQEGVRQWPTNNYEWQIMKFSCCMAHPQVLSDPPATRNEGDHTRATSDYGRPHWLVVFPRGPICAGHSVLGPHPEL